MKQFRLTDEGAVLFQPDPTNPLPGKPAGKIRKGDALLKPVAALTDESAVPAGMDKDAFAARMQDWLAFHVHEVLQPLAALTAEETVPDPAREISDCLYEALGIVPRADLEGPIGKLDEEGRRVLRARKIRLGPVLVFLPLLNKPAAVRLRALLWNLWYDKALPAEAPPDGVTSISVAGREGIDPLYFRAIGYPVYGPRAIRVDMLDRLIGAIYDSADKGVFKAKHEMAEWLGCPIPDLYAVLEAMDHKKISDPAEQAIEEKAAEPPPAMPEPEASALSIEPALAAEPAAPAPESEPGPAAESSVPAPVPQVKPELATFRLRRGKAYGRPPQKEPKKHPPRQQKPKRKEARKEPPRERVISAAPQKKVENSPFAILKDLKVKGRE